MSDKERHANQEASVKEIASIVSGMCLFTCSKHFCL